MTADFIAWYLIGAAGGIVLGALLVVYGIPWWQARQFRRILDAMHDRNRRTHPTTDRRTRP